MISFKVPEELAPSISAARYSNYERIKFLSSTQLFGISHLPRTLNAEEKKAKNHRVMKTPPPLPPRNISFSEVQVLKTSAEVSLSLTSFQY